MKIKILCLFAVLSVLGIACDNLKKEQSFLAKENELLKKENELLERERNLDKSNPKIAVTEIVDSVASIGWESITGNYVDKRNDDNYISEMKLNYISSNYSTFDINVGTPICNGSIQGSSRISDDGVAYYSTPTCKSLKFIFNNDDVYIEEKDCEEHGANCGFAGTYVLK